MCLKWKVMALALPVAFLVACKEQPSAPQASLLQTNAMASKSDSGSLKIYRFQDAFAACWTDLGNGLRACNATIPLGGGTEPNCGLQADAPPVDWLQVVINPVTFRVKANVQGQVWVTIRDLNNPGNCFGSALVAQGWGTVQYEDNDQFGATFSPSVRSVDSWKWGANGNLTAVSGRTVKYSGHYHAVWDGAVDSLGNGILRNEVGQVNLH
jgi:hypothetical protein